MRPTSPALLFTILLSLLPLPAFSEAAPGYEQILVPFDTGSFSGLQGTHWVVELRARNAAEEEVNLFPPNCVIVGREFPCEREVRLQGRRTQLLDLVPGNGGGLLGGFVYVPESHAGAVQFSLRVRETTFASDPVGVEIPVVRESEYRTAPSTFINVPVDPSVRASLRVYDPLIRPRGAYIVRVYREPDQVLLLEKVYETWVPADPPFPPVTPIVAEFSDALSPDVLGAVDRVTVTIERTVPSTTAPYWPLLSITSNISHRVTILNPQ